MLRPERRENGYRDYPATAVEQVLTIQFYLSLGLSTEQIAGFLNCVLVNKEAFCSQILPVYETKLSEIEAQILQLQQIKSNLVERIRSIREERSVLDDH